MVPGFIPKDSFDQKHDFLDWHADHPHTNFKGLYEHLRSRGYFVELLSDRCSDFQSGAVIELHQHNIL
jgi:hypothetical protein